MQDKVGEEFAGTISGVASFGLFVTLDGLNIDGLVHITELGRDYFHFDPARHALIGERSGTRVPARGPLRVKVVRVDLEHGQDRLHAGGGRRRSCRGERRPEAAAPTAGTREAGIVTAGSAHRTREPHPRGAGSAL